jgi:hypothetical protein
VGRPCTGMLGNREHYQYPYTIYGHVGQLYGALTRLFVVASAYMHLCGGRCQVLRHGCYLETVAGSEPLQCILTFEGSISGGVCRGNQLSQ